MSEGFDFEPRVLNKDFETIDELLSAYYDVRSLQKTGDNPAYMGLANYRNIIYGKKLWLQMNINPNAFTALPRRPYESSGYRLMPDFATTATSGNGVDEPGAIPDAKVPSISVMELSPKTLVNDPYAITMAQQRLAGKDDVATWDELMGALAKEFPMRVNSQLLVDNQTATGYNLTSLDKIVSSYAEIQAKSLTANTVDYGGLDRDAAASFSDAYVSCAAANRPITLDYFDRALTEVFPYWDSLGIDKKCWLTGWDIIERMQTLGQSQQRFAEWQNHQVTFNGVKSVPGTPIGFGVSSFRGIPVIADAYVKKETSGASRVYLLDTNYIHMDILVPPTFIEDRSYMARRALTTLATYYMLGETVCNKFRNQAKIRDLV
jgi:hypothetical protein